MLLVPVVDLRHGQAVHAVRGERAAYRPVRSRLVAGSEPVPVARALLAASGSPTLYVADLDALLGESPQLDSLAALLAALPAAALWLDAGFADARAAHGLLARLGDNASRVTPVFGSESLQDDAALPPDAVLSLDRRGGRALDRKGWWQAPQRWPMHVIVMTLDRVGASAGPDLDTLARLRGLAPRCRLIGAGGIRDAADLQRCADAGAWAWLVASALHDARLGGTRFATAVE